MDGWMDGWMDERKRSKGFEGKESNMRKYELEFSSVPLFSCLPSLPIHKLHRRERDRERELGNPRCVDSESSIEQQLVEVKNTYDRITSKVNIGMYTFPCVNQYVLFSRPQRSTSSPLLFIVKLTFVLLPRVTTFHNCSDSHFSQLTPFL